MLISGCDTGIDHSLTIELDQQGFNIFVGVLIQENVTLLKKEPFNSSDPFSSRYHKGKRR